MSAGDLGFLVSQLLPAQPALLFVGRRPVNGWDGFPLGDGLRCAGHQVLRLGVRTPAASGDAAWGAGSFGTGSFEPGESRFFQIWYRDPGGPCGSGSNLTNALEVVFGA